MGVLMLVVLFALWFAPRCLAEELRVGILAHRGEEVATARWQPTFSDLSQRLEGTTFSIIPLSLAGMNAAVDEDKIDLLLTNPGHFFLLARQHRVAPIVSLRTDRVGQPATGNRFGSVIFTRADNRVISGLADLKGKNFGAVAPDAFGGFLVAADTLLRNGINPWNDMRSINYYGFPQDRIVQAVLKGEVDAGTVRTGILELLVSQGIIAPTDIKLLNPTRIPGFELMLSTRVFPEWMLGATQNLSEPDRRRIALAMLQMDADSTAVRTGRYAGWSTIAYDGPVRALMDNIEAAKLAPQKDGPAQSLALSVLALAITSAALAALLFWRRQERTGAIPGPKQPPLAPAVALTPREREILHMVERGQTTKQIALQLGISPKTVEYHRGHLLQKFNAQNMTEVVVKATQTLSG